MLSNAWLVLAVWLSIEVASISLPIHKNAIKTLKTNEKDRSSDDEDNSAEQTTEEPFQCYSGPSGRVSPIAAISRICAYDTKIQLYAGTPPTCSDLQHGFQIYDKMDQVANIDAIFDFAFGIFLQANCLCYTSLCNVENGQAECVREAIKNNRFENKIVNKDHYDTLVQCITKSRPEDLTTTTTTTTTTSTTTTTTTTTLPNIKTTESEETADEGFSHSNDLVESTTQEVEDRTNQTSMDGKVADGDGGGVSDEITYALIGGGLLVAIIVIIIIVVCVLRNRKGKKNKEPKTASTSKAASSRSQDKKFDSSTSKEKSSVVSKTSSVVQRSRPETRGASPSKDRTKTATISTIEKPKTPATETGQQKTTSFGSVKGWVHEYVKEIVKTSVESLKAQHKKHCEGSRQRDRSRFREDAERCNKKKKGDRVAAHRYTDNFGHESVRVILSPRFGDIFINAHWVNKAQSMILTQGPLASTVQNLLMMVFDKDVAVLITVGKSEEIIKEGVVDEKYAVYVPDEGNTLQFGRMSITNEKREVLREGLFASKCKITLDNGESKTFTHILHEDWTDRTAPADDKCYIKAVMYIRKNFKISPKSPLVAHCSAGKGRSACYIIGLEMIESAHSSDTKTTIFDIWDHIRQARYRAVESFSQYLFVHAAFLSYLVSIGVIEKSEVQPFIAPVFVGNFIANDEIAANGTDNRGTMTT